MAFKFIVLAALVAAANAGVINAPLAYAAAPAQYAYAAPAQYAYAAPIAKAVVAKTIDAEYDPHPQYSYAYDVQDASTGDSKSQHESRDGDVVQGSYSLLESDGTRRTVDYTADSVNGFNAVVHKEPAQVAVKAIAAAPVQAVAKIAYAAPIAHAAQAISYAAPVAHAAYATPVVKTVAAAPAVHYAAAPAVQYGHYAAAPAVQYGHYAAAPALQYGHYAAAPAVQYGHYAAAPAVAHYAAAPAYAKVAAPLSYAAPAYYH